MPRDIEQFKNTANFWAFNNLKIEQIYGHYKQLHKESKVGEDFLDRQEEVSSVAGPLKQDRFFLRLP